MRADVLGEPGLHAEVREAVRPADEAPDAQNVVKPRRARARRRRLRAGTETTERCGAERRAERDGEQEDQAHRGEGVDGVVQDLREEPDPEDLETDRQKARAGGDRAKTKRRSNRQSSPPREARALASSPIQKREDPGAGAGRGGGQAIARAHADGQTGRPKPIAAMPTTPPSVFSA